jgi:crotonobetainyl-CoA:carnitine CoA-transferase CaiB-like acyl-CoA transferase
MNDSSQSCAWLSSNGSAVAHSLGALLALSVWCAPVQTQDSLVAYCRTPHTGMFRDVLVGDGTRGVRTPAPPFVFSETPVGIPPARLTSLGWPARTGLPSFNRTAFRSSILRGDRA